VAPDVEILPLSRVREGNPKFRIDSEFFNSEAQRAQEALKGHQTLEDLAISGYRVVYETTEILDPTEPEYSQSPLFIQAADLETPFIRLEHVGRVRKEDWVRYPKGRVEVGELLIEVKGLAEKVAVVPKNFPAHALVTGTCFKLKVSDPKVANFLVAYLTSRAGQALKNRLKSNLLVAYIGKDDLYSLPVPRFSPRLVECISDLVEAAIASDAEARSTVHQVQSLFDKLLGISFDQSPQNSIVESAKRVFAAARWDAEYYTSEFAVYRDALVKSGAKGFLPLEALLDEITNGQTPLRHDLSVGEVPFMGAEHVEDFFCNFATERRILLQHHNGILTRTRVREGDVLVAIKGRIGHAAVARKPPPELNVNQDVAVLRFNGRLPTWWIVAYLNSRFGQAQTKQISTGGINPFLGLGNLKRLEIPEFSASVMANLAQQTERQVEKAVAARDRANDLLRLARAVCDEGIYVGEKQALKLAGSAKKDA
jgi:type I restriction enzyme, S subunit